MSIRFRKTITLIPGIRFTITPSGVTGNFGPRGTSVSIGQRGAHLNLSIAGTGLSLRTKLGGKSVTPSAKAIFQKQNVVLREIIDSISVNDMGTILYHTKDGVDITEQELEQFNVSKIFQDELKTIVAEKCEEINNELEAIATLHHFLSKPVQHTYIKKRYTKEKPLLPTPSTSWLRYLPYFKNKIAELEEEKTITYKNKLFQWNQDKVTWDQNEIAQERMFLELNHGLSSTVESYFAEILSDIVWPYSTRVNFELFDKVMYIDLDLPEIEELPVALATPGNRGVSLLFKNQGPTALRKMYMSHIHSVGMRLIGEAFSCSCVIDLVICSAYSQRINQSNGVLQDDYLYSVEVSKAKWMQLNFSNLKSIDPVQALAQFHLIRDMTKTGVFVPIKPFSRVF